MKISMGCKKVRATELLVAKRGAKAGLIALRRWFNKFRGSSNTGKTGVEIPINRSANRENEINEARLAGDGETDERKRTILAVNEDELRDIANENLENELRELMSRHRDDWHWSPIAENVKKFTRDDRQLPWLAWLLRNSIDYPELPVSRNPVMSWESLKIHGSTASKTRREKNRGGGGSSRMTSTIFRENIHARDSQADASRNTTR